MAAMPCCERAVESNLMNILSKQPSQHLRSILPGKWDSCHNNGTACDPHLSQKRSTIGRSCILFALLRAVISIAVRKDDATDNQASLTPLEEQ